jgi:Eco29kI restriction endonuclease
VLIGQEPYNPLAKANLAVSVAQALLRSDVRPLDETDKLIGAGVYAIYYTGDFPPYEPLKRKNIDRKFKQPIYVGKAVPKGARKGGVTFESASEAALRSRLRQHAASIDEVANSESTNLSLSDFYYRSLVVDDIWIPLGESVLIHKFQPLWNMVIDGFGNKDPGNRRATQYRSSWDVLHPGREFAIKLADNPLKVPAIKQRIQKYFAGLLEESDKLPWEAESQD